MKVKELIDKYEAAECVVDFVSGKTLLKNIRRDLEQLDEPQPVKVKQFVADWYEENKDSFEFNVWDWIAFRDEAKKLENREFNNWINNSRENPIQILVNMHQFGYEVEKESKYIVKVKATGQCLGKYYINNEILSPRFIYTGRHADSFTRKELEEADFSWVFNCPGIEIEEAEG